MQSLLGGPRASLTEEEVVEALTWPVGGRYEWGVDLTTGLGVPIGDGQIWFQRSKALECETLLRAFTQSPDNIYKFPLSRIEGSVFSNVAYWPTEVPIYVSLDGETWYSAAVGSSIPGLESVDWTETVYVRVGGQDAVGFDTVVGADGHTYTLTADAVAAGIVDATGWRWPDAYHPPGMHFHGAVGNRFDVAGVSTPTGPCSWILRIAPTSWTVTSTQCPLAHYDNANAGWHIYLITSKRIQLGSYEAGANDVAPASTSNSCDFEDGVPRWIGITHITNDGAGNQTVYFWDGGAGEVPVWSSIGSTTVATTQVRAGAVSPLRVGSIHTGSNIFDGSVHDAYVVGAVGAGNMPTLDGPIAFALRHDDLPSNDAVSSFVTTSGHTATVFRVGDPPTNYVPASDPFIPDAEVGRGGTVTRIAVHATATDWTPGSARAVIRFTRDTSGWFYFLGSTGELAFQQWDGTTFRNISGGTFASGWANGSPAWLRVDVDNRGPTTRVTHYWAEGVAGRPEWDDDAWQEEATVNLPFWESTFSSGKVLVGGVIGGGEQWDGTLHSAVAEVVQYSAPSLPTSEFTLDDLNSVFVDDWLASPYEESTITPIDVHFAGYPQEICDETDLDFLDIQIGEPLGVREVSIDWAFRPPSVLDNNTDPSEVRRTGTMGVSTDGSYGPLPPWFNPMSCRAKPWVKLYAPSTETWVRFNVGTFILALSPVDDDGMVVQQEFTLADYTFRIANTELAEPIQWEVTSPILTQVKDALEAEFGLFTYVDPPVEYLTKTIAEELFYDAGETYADAVNGALAAIGLDSVIMDEDNRMVFKAASDQSEREPEWSYGIGTTALPGGTLDPLMPEIPNVLRFYPARGGPGLPVEGDGLRTVSNVSIGPASINARGEEVAMRVEVDAESQEELDAHAASQSEYLFAGGGERMIIKVLLNPLHSDRDVVVVDKPRFGVDSAVFNVTGWNYRLSHIGSEADVSMELTLERRIQLFGGIYDEETGDYDSSFGDYDWSFD